MQLLLDVTIITGDLNAKIGKYKVENLVGEYGLGTHNEQRERLIQFYQEKYV